MTTAAPGHFVNHIEPDYFGKLICKTCSGYGWSHGYYYGGLLDWVDCGTCKGNGRFSLVTYTLLPGDRDKESGKMILVPCMSDAEDVAHCPHCYGSCYFDKRGNPSRGRGTSVCPVCEAYGTVKYAHPGSPQHRRCMGGHETYPGTT